jgi:hypothetical protein
MIIKNKNNKMNRAMTITLTHTRMILISQHEKKHNADIVGELHLTDLIKLKTDESFQPSV